MDSSAELKTLDERQMKNAKESRRAQKHVSCSRDDCLKIPKAFSTFRKGQRKEKDVNRSTGQDTPGCHSEDSFRQPM